jgi:hypothetical protein
MSKLAELERVLGHCYTAVARITEASRKIKQGATVNTHVSDIR